MVSVRKKGRYEGHNLLVEFLLNQVAKYMKLCSFAKDLGVSQTEYDRITAPNTFTQDEQIHKVTSLTALNYNWHFCLNLIKRHAS